MKVLEKELSYAAKSRRTFSVSTTWTLRNYFLWFPFQKLEKENKAKTLANYRINVKYTMVGMSENGKYICCNAKNAKTFSYGISDSNVRDVLSVKL